jgi:putative endonuclease
MAAHLQAGRRAEYLGRTFLEKHGLRVLAANYRCRFGELDLVMTQGEELVIVEIRYRRRTGFIGPVDSISPAKRRRIARAAAHFLQRNRRFGNRAVRFDVLALSGGFPDPRVNWIKAAFTTEDLGNF